MATRFIVVPQWQGSGSARAMRLADGATAIAGDLPVSSTTRLELRAEAGEELGTGVKRASALIATHAQTTEALRTAWASDPDALRIVVGGDCGVDVAGIQFAVRSAAQGQAGPVALVWFDAHGDLNTPESSPSGIFEGMALRAALGEGLEGLADPEAAVRPAHAVLAGARDLDDPEVAYLAESGVTLVEPDRVSPASVADAVAATGATSVYLHIDLDVLDPGAFESVGTPEPFGIEVQTLAETILELRSRFALAGAGVTGFAPASDDDVANDMPVILRIIGALTRTL
ncbi:arginase family protein [Gryllotalpicola sp.]|uniref:arginase family protein n=1 Tax=Gryllotalpicola sp. TaxID=1932787 RepID=UPI00261587DC|nr:arginase family protein [Gryllotalpicola sp.]